MKNKYTYGDTVTLDSNSGTASGAIGEIVGFYEIETAEIAQSRGFPIGTVFYTVEFPNGESAEVLEEHLVLQKE